MSYQHYLGPEFINDLSAAMAKKKSNEKWIQNRSFMIARIILQLVLVYF